VNVDGKEGGRGEGERGGDIQNSAAGLFHSNQGEFPIEILSIVFKITIEICSRFFHRVNI
jgi:hypothetical protein